MDGWINKSTSLQFSIFYNRRTQRILYTVYKLYTVTFDEFSFAEFKNEVEEILGLSEFSPEDPEKESVGPHFIEAYRTIEAEKSSTDGYIVILMCYAPSSFQDFESFPRIVIHLDEEDIQSILKHYTSIFITYEVPPNIYTIKDL